jgi:hypothetical protein
MLESLRRCEGFEASLVTIFVDGPKNEADRAAVEDVRMYVASLGLPNVRHIFSDFNRGLRQAVYDGVSAICEEHGRVIVLEDDLVLSPIALRFFNGALDHYEEAEEVWSIAGYLYDTPGLRNFHRTLVLPYAHPWGWATWQRAWRRFELDSRPTDAELNARSFRTGFDMNGLYPFTSMLTNSIGGRVNSWYAHWYYTIFRHGGRSIFPPRRVVDNFGISAGTHGGTFNPHERLVRRPPLLEKLVDFADASEIDYDALDQIKGSWEARVQRFIARSGTIRARLKSTAR